MSNTRDTSSIVLRGSVQKGTPAQPSVTHKIAMSACGARFQNNDCFYWRDAIALLECEPGLAELNSHVTTKALQEG